MQPLVSSGMLLVVFDRYLLMLGWDWIILKSVCWPLQTTFSLLAAPKEDMAKNLLVLEHVCHLIKSKYRQMLQLLKDKEQTRPQTHKSEWQIIFRGIMMFKGILDMAVDKSLKINCLNPLPPWSLCVTWLWFVLRLTSCMTGDRWLQDQTIDLSTVIPTIF